MLLSRAMFCTGWNDLWLALKWKLAVQGTVRRMRLLAEILQVAEATQQSSRAAEKSACLLTVLHKLLSRASLQSGPRGSSEAPISIMTTLQLCPA